MVNAHRHSVVDKQGTDNHRRLRRSEYPRTLDRYWPTTVIIISLGISHYALLCQFLLRIRLSFTEVPVTV